MAGLFTGSFTTPTNAPPAPDEAEPPTNKLWMGDVSCLVIYTIIVLYVLIT